MSTVYVFPSATAYDLYEVTEPKASHHLQAFLLEFAGQVLVPGEDTSIREIGIKPDSVVTVIPHPEPQRLFKKAARMLKRTSTVASNIEENTQHDVNTQEQVVNELERKYQKGLLPFKTYIQWDMGENSQQIQSRKSNAAQLQKREAVVGRRQNELRQKKQELERTFTRVREELNRVSIDLATAEKDVLDVTNDIMHNLQEIENLSERNQYMEKIHVMSNQIETTMADCKKWVERRKFEASWPDWTAEDIRSWIVSLDNGAYEEYKDELYRELTENKITGKQLSDLFVLGHFGIESIDDRIKINGHIRQLTASGD